MLRRFLVAYVLLVAATVAFGVVGARGAQPSKVQLTITINGEGMVAGRGLRFHCAVAKCTKSFSIPPGPIRLTASPAPTWRFTTWSHVRCRPSTETACTFRAVRRVTRVSATFVPPGARLNPIPLGKTAAIGLGWSLTVLSVKPDAVEDVLGVKGPNGEPINSPPPAGAQDFMVLVNAIYEGGGKGNPTYLVNNTYAAGSHNAKYDTQENSCGTWPQPSFQYAPDVFPGQTLTGNICYQIATSDASSLMLFTELHHNRLVWFALH